MWAVRKAGGKRVILTITISCVLLLIINMMLSWRVAPQHHTLHPQVLSVKIGGHNSVELLQGHSGNSSSGRNQEGDSTNGATPASHASAKVTISTTFSKWMPKCVAFIGGNVEALTEFQRHKKVKDRHLDLKDLFNNSIIHSSKCNQHVSNLNHQKRLPTETDFPLAYSIVVHHKAVQLEALLRSIYSPQNIYCIHVDKKAKQFFKDAVKNIIRCYNNVFISSKSEHIVYATYSRLQADINCLTDLMASKVQWKYAINLSGQDFPLRTNYEIVLYLKSLNGSNDIPGVLPNSQNLINRFKYKHKVVEQDGQSKVLHGNKIKPPPPNNVTIYFGTAFFFASRAFVKFILTDSFSKKLLNWFEDTYSPDENYWITLNSLPGVPGGRTRASWASAVRWIGWQHLQGQGPPCLGKYVRTICVQSLEDLPWVVKQGSLFVNKLDIEFDPYAVRCLGQWLYSRKMNLAKENLTKL